MPYLLASLVRQVSATGGRDVDGTPPPNSDNSAKPLLDDGMGGPRMTQLLDDAKPDRGALLNCPAGRSKRYRQEGVCQLLSYEVPYPLHSSAMLCPVVAD